MVTQMPIEMGEMRKMVKMIMQMMMMMPSLDGDDHDDVNADAKSVYVASSLCCSRVSSLFPNASLGASGSACHTSLISAYSARLWSMLPQCSPTVDTNFFAV
jgi:hypothetical protein